MILRNMQNLLVTIFLFFLISTSEAFHRDKESNTGFFWHISDIHVDQNYSRTGNPKDLCHSGKTPHPDNGRYGNFLCDSPESLVNVTFEAMKNIKDDPDFIVWTGDNLPHTNTFDAEWNVIYEALNNISMLFSENFPNIPVYPCIGNHDTFPPNMLIPNDTSSSIYKDILSKGGWDKYLNAESTKTFLKGGYFSQVIKPSLRIISLNTILWYTPNTFTSKIIDPADQFKWLEDTLNKSLKSTEKVYIIGHVPPGFYNRVQPGLKSDPTFHPQHLEAYLNILKKYSKIIIGQMFGHLHMDMFQLFTLDSGSFVSSSILASSITPWHFESKYNISLPVNPSVRLMHYDRNSGLLKDYDQYYLNLTKANKLAEIEPTTDLYQILYSFTKAYKVPDVSTESLIKVYESIKRNETLFDMFYKFSAAGKESFLCDELCKIAQLCSIGSTSITEYNNCMKKRNRLSFICYSDYVADNISSNIYIYALGLIILCVLIVLIIFGYSRYKKSNSDIYAKLLTDFE